MIIIFEDAVTIYGEKADKIERILRREHGYKNKQFNDKLKELSSYEDYYKWLVSELQRVEAVPSGKVDDLDVDINLIDKPIEKDVSAPEKDDPVRDEAIVDILEYLQRVLNKDRVRAIAARFHIDPDLYQLAGLGNLPDNYSDEDVWNTMSMSKDRPFHDHIWQPYYIESLYKLQNLPSEVKEAVKDILQQHSQPREVEYPIDDRTSGTTFEAVTLLQDLIIESDGKMLIIPSDTKICIVS